MTTISRNTTRTRFTAWLILVLAGLIATLTSTGISSSTAQRSGGASGGGGGAGKVSMRDFSFVLMNADDLRNLPSGENRIVQKPGGENRSGARVPTASVRFVVDNVATGNSFSLNKTGNGTLVFPNMNKGGVTKVGAGRFENSPSHAGLSKTGTGTLVLSNSNDVVYEFRNLESTDFERVQVPIESYSLNFTKIELKVQKERPSEAMLGWPFKRLLYGPGKGIAQVEGWQPGTITSVRPGSKYVCTSDFCACSGTSDCLNLVNSGSCSSEMNCDGAGNSVKCYCKSR
jgi:hypothetical protein